tara:strand:- start:295 stop:525 length:231 start_codon:yes stop_codon:yes gene_type:complete
MENLNKEKAWITFMAEDWQKVWHPITDVIGNHLDWNDSNEIMNHCRRQFNNENNWVTFGIAPTSQMEIGNAVRDSL